MNRSQSLSPIVLITFMLAIAPTPQNAVASDTERGPLPSYLIARKLPTDLIALEKEGKLSAAEAWLDKAIAADQGDTEAFVIERERLRRVRRDYGQTPDELLEKLRQSIPDVTEADTARWRAAGELLWIEIDGDLRYFRKEPRNFFRASQEGRDRRDAAKEKTEEKKAETAGDPNAVETKKYDLLDYVLKGIEITEETGEAMPYDMRVKSRHTVTVKAGRVPAGEIIRCWIPVPQEYRQQRDVAITASSAGLENSIIAPNGAGHRTIYMEAPAGPESEPNKFWVEHEYTISPYIPQIDPDEVEEIDPADPELTPYLAKEPPHVDINKELRKLAREIVGDETNPYLKLDKIFRWMDSNIPWCPEMEYSTFTSITDKILRERKGDCGIQSLFLVALCRAQGIPARWQSGWAMRPPDNEGLHDWTEVYIAPYGWVPVDPSYGLKKHEDERVRDFYIGNMDAFRMIANVDYAAEFTPPKNHWRSDNIDNQRGEVEWEGGNLYYDDFYYSMESEYEFTGVE